MTSSNTFTAHALAAKDTSGVFSKIDIERRKPLADDVVLRILYSGICHSDLHMARAEWASTYYYPMVPGHEIVGEIEEVGSSVTKWKKGQIVGVGVFVDSCRKCESCKRGLQQFCSGDGVHKDRTHYTYNTCLKDEDHIHVKNSEFGEILHGGYSSHITINENYVVNVPSEIPVETAAPLLCAGITVYSPLKHFGDQVRKYHQDKQIRVGVAGFGGLGHCAVKIAKAMGFHVTVISQSTRKEENARKAGADAFVNSSDRQSMKAARESLHLMINTIAAQHELAPLFELMTTDSIICMVGLPPNPLAVSASDLVNKRMSLAGSLIGGIPETQEMLDFCAKHKIFPDVELIDASEVNRAYFELSQNATTANRFVIKTSDTLKSNTVVDADPRIDPKTWHVHSKCTIHPASANIHAAFHQQTPSATTSTTGGCPKSKCGGGKCGQKSASQASSGLAKHAPCILGTVAIAGLALVSVLALRNRK